MKKLLKFAIVALFAAAVAPVYGSIYTNMVPAVPSDTFPSSGLMKTFVLEGTVDLAAQNAAGSTNAAADKVAVIKVPSGSYVMAVSARVVSYPTPATTLYTNSYSVATTFDVGDGDTANNWIALASATNGATMVASTPVLTAPVGNTNTSVTVTWAPTASMGKFYTTTQNLNVRFTAAPGISGIFRVKAFCVKFD